MTATFALLDGLGGPEILVIGILALLMFGSKRLPELGRGLGRAMREFKRATSGVEENLREVMREDPLAPTLRPAPRQIARGGTPAAPVPPTAAAESSSAPSSVAPPAATAPTTTGSAERTAPDASSSARSTGAEDEIAS